MKIKYDSKMFYYIYLFIYKITRRLKFMLEGRINYKYIDMYVDIL